MDVGKLFEACGFTGYDPERSVKYALSVTIAFPQFPPDGKTECRLCGETIYSERRIMATQINGKSRLSDWVLCESCFEQTDAGVE